MNERQERAICERLARLCRNSKAICPMTRLNTKCPNWEAPCPFATHCRQATAEEWRRVASIPTVRELIDSYN